MEVKQSPTQTQDNALSIDDFFLQQSDQISPIGANQRISAMLNFRIENPQTWKIPSISDNLPRARLGFISSIESSPKSLSPVLILPHDGHMIMPSVPTNSKVETEKTQICSNTQQGRKVEPVEGSKPVKPPKKTKRDNQKNIPRNVVTAMLRQATTGKVIRFLLNLQCEKKEVRIEEVLGMMKEISRSHLSLARLRQIISPEIGDPFFAVKDVFGDYFQMFMRDWFEAYVWNSQNIYCKMQYITFGIKVLSNLRVRKLALPQ